MTITELRVSQPHPRNGVRVGSDTRVGPEIDLAAAGRHPGGLALSVLGTFAFRRGDRALALPGGSRKLLALLALRRQPMTRVLAAYTLWPDAPDRDASCRLRSALCRLKHTAGDVVDVAKLDLQLRPEVAVDLHRAREFVYQLLDRPESAMSGDETAAAIRLLSGDLLPGWDDEWVAADSHEWRQLRLHALEAMAAHLVAEGRCVDATLAALAAVRSAPLRESAHGALIKTFLAVGNQKEALDQFDRFRADLGAELRAEPTAMLCGLVDELRGGAADRYAAVTLR